EVVASYLALTEMRVIARSSGRNHDRRQALLEQPVGMVQPGAVDGRRASAVLRCTENHDGVGGMRFVRAGRAHDLEADEQQKHCGAQDEQLQNPAYGMKLGVATGRGVLLPAEKFDNLLFGNR